MNTVVIAPMLSERDVAPGTQGGSLRLHNHLASGLT